VTFWPDGFESRQSLPPRRLDRVLGGVTMAGGGHAVLRSGIFRPPSPYPTSQPDTPFPHPPQSGLASDLKPSGVLRNSGGFLFLGKCGDLDRPALGERSGAR